MDIEELAKYYRGFYLDSPQGNNAFSFEERANKKIFVPPLIQGSFEDLAIGEEVVFSEIFKEKEINRTGLENFIYWPKNGKDIFFFDNHNHAFFFWLAGLKTGKIKPGNTLVHVDQHTDMREPDKHLAVDPSGPVDLKAVFDYTNFELNVGNFVKPALALKVFSRIENINNSFDFDKPLNEEFVLDIDMDIFSPDMDYIDDALKLKKIKECIQKARLITVATSPYFMDQSRAIDMIKELFQS